MRNKMKRPSHCVVQEVAQSLGLYAFDCGHLEAKINVASHDLKHDCLESQ